MAFIQEISGKNGPIYKVHYKEPLTGKRRCKSFDRMKAARHFRDNVPKQDYLHDADTANGLRSASGSVARAGSRSRSRR